MEIVKDKTKPKISKSELRKMIAKEPMLNGKAFEKCSRFELFEMIVALARQVGVLTKEKTEREFMESIVGEVEKYS